MRAAQFAGTCAECEGHVSVGDMIENRGGEWVHVSCEPALTDADFRPGDKICPACQMIHKGECL